MSYSINYQQTPFQAVATVSATLGGTDTLLWSADFVPTLQSYTSTNEPSVSISNDAAWYLRPGVLRVTAVAGIDPLHPVTLIWSDTEVEIDRLQTSGQQIEIHSPYGAEEKYVLARKETEGNATIQFEETLFNTDGIAPLMQTIGHDFIVSYLQPYSSPRAGVITAVAKIYNAAGTVIAASDPITLTVAGNSSGC